MDERLRGVVREKLDLLVSAFFPVLYAADDPDFSAHRLAGDKSPEERERYRYWEWPQGVGLFGLWNLYEATGNQDYLTMVTDYYERQIAQGLPGKNVNTMAPILPLSSLAEATGRKDFLSICEEWVDWTVHGGLDRTEEGGFQHRTTDSENKGELWDDTLMMSVLAVANMGRILKRQEYVDEAIYQFLLHVEYLADPIGGLWYHGFTFEGRHRFSEAFWGRGNSWATIAIPTLLDMVEVPPSVRSYLSTVLRRQVDALAACQDAGGMWHTLLDDPSSYLEASATAGFGYGILKAVHMGLLEQEYGTVAEKALPPILASIDDRGIVHRVSYGTPMGRSSKEFYRTIVLRPMPYGQASAMLFLMEEEKGHRF